MSNYVVEHLKKEMLEEANTIRNAKDNMLSKFHMLLDITNDYSGFPELSEYQSYINSPPEHIWQLSTFTLFNVYRLSRKLNNETLKDFECDCCQGITELYREVYNWLKDFMCESQPRTTVKYRLRQKDTNILFSGDTMTSVFTPLNGYMKLKFNVQHTSSPTEDWEVYWMKNKWHIESSEPMNAYQYGGYSSASILPTPRFRKKSKQNGSVGGYMVKKMQEQTRKNLSPVVKNG